MKETQIEDCQFKCGGKVDWISCDDEGENCVIALVSQCGHCGRLNDIPPKNTK